MPTYKQIQNDIKVKYGMSVKTCWIAHVKELNGLNPKRAQNRLSEKRKYECPENIRPIIESSMNKLGMFDK